MIRKLSLLIFLPFLGVVTSLHAFVVFYPVGNTPMKWNVNSSQLKPTSVNPTTKAIRYYIASDTYSDANRTNEVNAIKASFDQWQIASGSNLRFEFAGFISPTGLDTRFDDKNVIFWAKNNVLVNGGQENLSGRRSWTSVTYALDGSILDADIVLNGVQYSWFTDSNDSTNQAQYVESIMTHEIGHFLGLDHTPAGGASVIDGGNGINTNSGLSADEIAAMRYLYGTNNPTRATVRGTIRRNGAGILGAAVIVEDAAGNIAGATVSQAAGNYSIYSLDPGTYKLRVTPLDPSNTGNGNSLLRGAEIAVDYTNAVTGFLATSNLTFTVQAGENKTQNVDVISGDPLRITSLSRPIATPDLVTVVRYASILVQGQSNNFVGVSGPGISSAATLSVTGDGLTLGNSIYYPNKTQPGVHSLVVPISVSSNATPGLRTLVVSQNGSFAYANGYLEIASSIQDYNFDKLDDRFQRKYWNLWTAPEAGPTADPDQDGFSNSFEYRTGTDPVNPASNRLVLQQPANGRFGPQLSWLSDPGKTYQVYGAASVFSPQWVPVGAPVTATAEFWSLPIQLNASPQFFRLELKKQ